METSTARSQLNEIVEPVLRAMPKSVLRPSLIAAFTEEQQSLFDVESAFRKLTARRHAPEALRKFFGTWSRTNNSAASVAGLANRITLAARTLSDPAKSRSLFEVCSCLQRITDEDLGALGGALHSDLFHTMATALCRDDQWLLQSNCLKSALEFKDWTDRQRLRNRELTVGLLTTLIHEIYTHGELEFILPLFRNWCERHMGIPGHRVPYTVAWVTVHTGGTERNHFAHAVNATHAYAATAGVALSESMAAPIFREYLARKAAVMRDCAAALEA